MNYLFFSGMRCNMGVYTSGDRLLSISISIVLTVNISNSTSSWLLRFLQNSKRYYLNLAEFMSAQRVVNHALISWCFSGLIMCECSSRSFDSWVNSLKALAYLNFTKMWHPSRWKWKFSWGLFETNGKVYLSSPAFPYFCDNKP